MGLIFSHLRLYSSDFIVIFHFVFLVSDTLPDLTKECRLKCKCLEELSGVGSILVNNKFTSRIWIIHRDGKMEVKEILFH